MLRRQLISMTAFSALLSVLIIGQVHAQKKSNYYRAPAPQGDVEYNATDKSPTLPLVQTPPPQNYQNSVQVGTPSYYYYYYPPVAPYGGGGYYGGGVPGQAGVNFYNSGGQTRRSFWYNTSIPGQVAPGGGGYGSGFGPGYYGPGGYGPGGYYPPSNGGTLYIP